MKTNKSTPADLKVIKELEKFGWKVKMQSTNRIKKRLK